ncbi:hypothetical protein F2Q69_00012199 [Brassica cretica]|uniref:Uncharacterized protein n=1 Tax=Brassica cretica TaxID=69181 RepID=A0A8S9QQT2_BRACR|nr:hypothetical protein F2Q69_00012199 [Brassica cretica]
MDQPSQKFQEELAKTQATGAETVSDPNDAEKGLQEVQGLLGEKLVSPEDEDHVMEMDEIKAHLLEHGINMDAADDLPDFSEEETEEAIMAYDEEAQPQEEEEQLLTGDGDDAAVADLGKKKTTRKRLFKLAANTAGSTKMRIASALSFLTYATNFGTDHILEHVRLQQLLHLVSLNQVQFQSRWRISRYVRRIQGIIWLRFFLSKNGDMSSTAFNRLICTLGSNNSEKEDGGGLILRPRGNRKKMFGYGERIRIVVHLALILLYINDRDVIAWDEITTDILFSASRVEKMLMVYANIAVVLRIVGQQNRKTRIATEEILKAMRFQKEIIESMGFYSFFQRVGVVLVAFLILRQVLWLVSSNQIQRVGLAMAKVLWSYVTWKRKRVRGSVSVRKRRSEIF